MGTLGKRTEGLWNRRILLGLGLILAAEMALGGLILRRGLSPRTSPPLPPRASQREFAAALVEHGLYQPALAEYERTLSLPGVTPEEQAKLHYVMGNLCRERLHDYSQAMAHYLKIQYLYPDSPLASEVGPLIVECLDRLGRTKEAQAAMEAATALAPRDAPAAPPKDSGPVVAKIGDREITRGELEREIAPGVTDPEQQWQRLQEYVLRELLYNAAKRRGLDRDQEIAAQVFEIKKDLMAQRLMQQELGQVQVSDSEVELYYQAHRDRYMERKEGEEPRQKTLEEARTQVQNDLYQERLAQARQRLLQKLLKAEKAQLFAEHFPHVASPAER